MTAAAVTDVTTGLERVARAALVALPVLFLIGRAPADWALSLIALLFLVRSGLARDWRWLGTPWVALALGLWAYLLVASALAADPGAAYGRALPFGRFVLFAAALQHWLLLERQVQRRLLMVLGAVLAFVVLDSLLQFVSGQDVFGQDYEAKRLTGPFSGNVPGTFISKTCFPVIGLSLALAALWPRWRRGLLTIALVVVLGATIALTGERMALLTFGLGVLVFSVLLREMRGPLLIAVVAATALITGAIATSPDLRQRLVSHTTYDLEDFWERRYGELILRTVRVWQTAPLTGIGLKNFRDHCVNDHFQAKGPPRDRCYTHPHSIYLEWLVEAGLIGLAGFLALLVCWGHTLIQGLRSVDTQDRAIASGALAALVVFLWPLRTSMSFFSNWNAILFWLILALALSLLAPGGRRPNHRPAPPFVAGRSE